MLRKPGLRSVVPSAGDLDGSLCRQLCLLLAVSFSCLFSLSVSASNALSLQLQQSETDGNILVHLTNNSDEVVSVLSWDTAFEHTLSSNVFKVRAVRKGMPILQTLPYIGRMVKRAAPGDDAFILMRPGETISTVVPVATYYQLAGDGKHSVSYSGEIKYDLASGPAFRSRSGVSIVDAESEAALQTQHVESQSIDLTLNRSPILQRVQPPEFNACSVDQQADINVAANLSQVKNLEATQGLAALTLAERETSPRYRLWFGRYEESRFDTVLSNLRIIDDVFENETISFDCSCNDEGVYGFVFVNRPYEMFLCPVFWQLPDERVDTIIHELTHFDVVASTIDVAYGPPATQSLARRDPATAIRNADNYSYFISNLQPTAPLVDDGTGPVFPDEIEVIELGRDDVLSDSVVAGETLYITVSGVSVINLESTTGDADLEVYSDAGLSNQICESNSATEIDSCEVNGLGTLYVSVVGYSEATFVLSFEPAVNDGSVPQLVSGESVSGFAGTGEIVVYQAENLGSVELTSESGDADLYVFNSTDLIEENLVCQSVLVTALDQCRLPEGQTLYVVVYGYADANYSLVALDGGNSSDPDELPLLQPDVAASGFLDTREAAEYGVSGVGGLTLFSVSGDADLFVYMADGDDAGQVACISEEFTADSATDFCDLAEDRAYVVVVYGFDATQFELVFSPATTDDGQTSSPTPEPVVTPDPVTTPETPTPDPVVVNTPVAGTDNGDDVPVVTSTGETSSLDNTGTVQTAANSSSGGGGGGAPGGALLLFMLLGLRYKSRALASQ